MTQSGWIFLGQNDMGAEALRALVDAGHRPSLVVTRLPREHENEVETTSAALELDLVKLPSINDPSALRVIGRTQPYLGVCCGWPELFSVATRERASHGWLNLHPSKLPLWRGGNPIAWQIATGQDSIGCTAHWMGSSFDDGPIVAQTTVALPRDADGRQARRLGGRALGLLAAEVVGACLDGNPPSGQPQDGATATWCPPNRMRPLVTTDMTVASAARVVRAFSPYPGAPILIGTAVVVLADPVAHTTERPPPSSGCEVIEFADGWLVGRLVP